MAKNEGEQITLPARLFTLREAAAYLGMGLTNLREEIDEGALETVRRGKRWVRITDAALADWLRQHTT